MPDPRIEAQQRVLDEVAAAKAGVPVAQFAADREAARIADELALAKAAEADAAALTQANSNAELEVLFEELRALPRVILSRYPGATRPGDLKPDQRAHLAAALSKHLDRFLAHVERDS